ncbi:MAG TPA: RpiB/LacA/LacB family sugar-phosphate isomerase [Candidatus Paceibacterota bacterium]|nr:RpiB/LacA/LacB family sugar-phosphate isomerase [Candidatus Paceibacterota bacterium]HQB57040.1 RpiB/LacA/LacB family sugar-phosphate isomerase [Candidatus Paceibacterota bacterium]
MKIYLATDHAGFEMKEALKLFLEVEKDDLKKELEQNGQVISSLEIVDFGAYEYDEDDDYPKYVSACAGALSSDIYTGKKNGFGIVFGGSGEGEAIVAGKYKGIRAGVINSENLELVKLLREHNNANIISFGARFISEEFAKQAIKTFLLTKFDEADETTVTRHERRVEQIEDLEENIDTKVTKTELDELDRLASMRAEVSDN